MAAKAQRRRRAGAGRGSAALIPLRAVNGGTGDPLARCSVGSVCNSINVEVKTDILRVTVELAVYRSMRKKNIELRERASLHMMHCHLIVSSTS